MTISPLCPRTTYEHMPINTITLRSSIVNPPLVFAPGDYYQGSGLLEEWLKRAGAPPIKELK
jgi:hypothetical protein